MTINNRLRELRKVLNLTQPQFGETLGVGIGVIKNLERNLTEPKKEFINLVCTIHNVNKDWLLTGNGDMFNEPPSLEEKLIEHFKDIQLDTNSFKMLLHFFEQFILAYRELTPEQQETVNLFVHKMCKTSPNDH